MQNLSKNGAAARVGSDPPIVGILGGMGPVASAEFLKSIYEDGIESHEQAAPAVVLYSDPSIPDRTEAFLAGQEDRVLEPVVRGLDRLQALGASDLILCCFTVHHLMTHLPSGLRARVVSLLDVLVAELRSRDGNYLLLCSRGSRALRLFETHPAWPLIAHRVILPDRGDQDAIHDDVIHAIKRNADLDGIVPLVDALIAKYGADGCIAGCTEIHVLAKHGLRRADGRRFVCIDPLTTLAHRIRFRHELLDQGGSYEHSVGDCRNHYSHSHADGVEG
jgi:aspartate racemase